MALSRFNNHIFGNLKVVDSFDNANARIRNIAMPIEDFDAATKKYVDNTIIGSNISAGQGLTNLNNVFSVNSDQSQITKLGNINTGSWQANSIQISYGGTGTTNFSSNRLLYYDGSNSLRSVENLIYDGVFLQSNCKLVIGDSTDASTTSGSALQVTGGMYLGKDLIIGKHLKVTGDTTVGNIYFTSPLNVSDMSVSNLKTSLMSCGNAIFTNCSTSNFVGQNVVNSFSTTANALINSLNVVNQTVQNVIVSNSMSTSSLYVSGLSSFFNVNSNSSSTGTGNFTNAVIGDLVNIRLTSGNVVIQNSITVPNLLFTNLIGSVSSIGSLYNTTSTIGNLTSTNVSSLNTSCGNLVSTTNTFGNIVSGSISSGSLVVGGLMNANNAVVSGSISSGSLVVSSDVNSNLLNSVNLISTNASMSNLIISSNASMSNLRSINNNFVNSTCSNLNVNNSLITSQLFSTQSTLSNLSATNITAGSFTSTTSSVSNSYLVSGTVGKLISQSSTLGNVFVSNIFATNATSNSLIVSGLLSAQNCSMTNSTCTSLNVSNCSVSNLIISQSTVANITITNSKLTNLTSSNSILTVVSCGNASINVGNITNTLSFNSNYNGVSNDTSGAFLSVLPSSFNDTFTANGGTIPSFYANFIGRPTISAQNLNVQLTKAANMYVSNNVTPGTNISLQYNSNLLLGYAENSTGGNLVGQLAFERNDGKPYSAMYTESTTNRFCIANASFSGGGGIGLLSINPITFDYIPSSTNLTPQTFASFSKSGTHFYNTQESTNATSGALLVDGGMTVAKNLTTRNFSTPGYSIQSGLTEMGTSIISQTSGGLILNNSSNLTNYTITLPDSAFDGQRLFVSSINPITNTTIGNTTKTINQSLTANSGIQLLFVSSLGWWVKIN